MDDVAGVETGVRGGSFTTRFANGFEDFVGTVEESHLPKRERNAQHPVCLEALAL